MIKDFNDDSYFRIIEPPSGFLKIDLHELMQYRSVLYSLIYRHIVVRYRDTIFGSIYAVILPIFNMLLFTFVFSYVTQVQTDGIPYPIFSYSGLILWAFFSAVISGAAGSILGNLSMLTKVYFPRIFFPLTPGLASLSDYLISLCVLGFLIVYYNYHLSLLVFLVPIAVLGTFFLGFGIGSFFATLTVKYRDMQMITPAFIQILMFISPVLYPVTTFPSSLSWILQLNPMSSFLNIHRACLLGQDLPPIGGFILAFILSFIIFIAGIAYMKQKEPYFADLI